MRQQMTILVFESSCHLPTSLPHMVYCRLHIISFNADRQERPSNCAEHSLTFGDTTSFAKKPVQVYVLNVFALSSNQTFCPDLFYCILVELRCSIPRISNKCLLILQPKHIRKSSCKLRHHLQSKLLCTVYGFHLE